MSAHTPGPWKVHVVSDKGNRDYQIRTEKPHNPSGGLGKHVATVNRYLREGWIHDERLVAEPNARLIAAAPELLEALRSIAGLTGPDAIIHARDIAADAIAKAEGES